MAKIRFITGFPNYTINTNGFVYRRGSCVPLKPGLNTGGYKFVGLYKNKKRFYKLTHRLLLETFVGPCPEDMEGCHNDGNKQNNRLENLRWDTHSNNSCDMVRHGTCQLSKNKGEKHYKSKLTEKDIINIIHLWNTKLFRQHEIADIYKVRQDTISRIVNRKRWKYLWDKENFDEAQ